MTREERVWRALGVIIALVTAFVPVWIAVDHFERGGDPEKHVELQTIGPLNPLKDLSPLAKDSKLELVVGEKAYESIVIWQLHLSNTGQTAIVPSDFFENLRVTVAPPWEIIAIRPLYGAIRIEWKQIGPETMEASPFLFNPGDRVSQTIYLTAGRKASGADEAKSIEPTISARVTNLKSLTRAKSIFDEEPRVPMVYLTLWDVVALLLVASLFFAWYARTLVAVGLVELPSASGFLLLVAAAVLSYAAAEVVVYYLLGGNPTLDFLDGTHLLDWRYQFQNWLVLGLHMLAVGYLYHRSGDCVNLEVQQSDSSQA